MPVEGELYNTGDFTAPGRAALGLRRLCVDGPYLVRSFYGDELARFWSFSGALAFLAQRWADGRGGDITNLDRCDGGGGDDGQGFHDGITDAERELLDDALTGAGR